MKKQIREWKPSYAYYTELIDSDLVFHLYCWYKGKQREVYREYENGKKEVRAGIWDRTGYMGGIHPLKNFVKPTRKDLYWYEYVPTNRPIERIERNFTCKKTMIKLTPVLKYVYPDNYCDRQFLWEFITTIRKYPQLEMIYKSDQLKEYWRYKCLYKLNKHDLFMLAKFIEVDERMRLSENNIRNMIWLMKHPDIRTQEQLDNIRWLNMAKKIKNFYGEYKETARYLKKQYSSNYGWTKEGLLREYQDYLNMCESLGIYGAEYPRKLSTAITQVAKKFKSKKSKEPMLKEKTYNKYNNKLVKSKNLTLYIPKTPKDLINVGNKMDNCVGRCDYDKKVIEGTSLIVVACKDNKYEECCEINLKEKKIEQLYAKSNSLDGMYHIEARRLINRFIRSAL